MLNGVYRGLYMDVNRILPGCRAVSFQDLASRIQCFQELDSSGGYHNLGLLQELLHGFFRSGFRI